MAHWYAGECYDSTPSNSSDPDKRDALHDSAGPWLLTSQLRNMLGENGELDPGIFEESWASGAPVKLEQFRVRPDQAANVDVDGLTFAELSGFRNFFSQPVPWSEERFPSAPSAHATRSYIAHWLFVPPEGSASEGGDPTPNSEPADREKPADVPARFTSMTHELACRLLCVSAASNEMQIKSAYRRMVGAWHPDRKEQCGETERACATGQMAAINEAYRFLRSRSSAAH